MVSTSTKLRALAVWVKDVEYTKTIDVCVYSLVLFWWQERYLIYKIPAPTIQKRLLLGDQAIIEYLQKKKLKVAVE